MSFESNLSDIGITLPEPAAPVASYRPAVIANGMLYVSGQLPFIDGAIVTGKLGADVSLERGVEAARACGIMLIAQIKAALDGDLERVVQIVKLGAFVASTPDFSDQPKVVNGASDLMEQVFGEAGRHARSAVATPVLPLNAAVEIDAIVALRN
ncbi:RidA family protein [Novosphingopyxis baekryungensis]|uniref:RidA family protein n=1 Tax=Novosphingopyxis baekryungensis TaxID=279369 RepID=UPI0003B3982C|nr:RidA family protein [Novosphingopyxis baekryungensis]